MEEAFQEDGLKKEIEEIENSISYLENYKENLKKEAQIHLNNRENSNCRFKKIKSEATEYRNKRDLLNQEVQDLKLKREDLKKELLSKREEIQKKLISYNELKKKIPNNFKSLKIKQEELEWIIQTNPLSKQEEQKLIERINEIEHKLVDYIRMKDLKNNISQDREDIKLLKNQIKSFYEDQTGLSKKSDIYHEEFLKIYKKAEKFRKESFNSHESYKECQDKLFQIRIEIKHKIIRVKGLRKKLYEILKLKQAGKDNDFKKKTLDGALKKFKKDRKVTLEEFKLVLENRESPKD